MIVSKGAQQISTREGVEGAEVNESGPTKKRVNENTENGSEE